MRKVHSLDKHICLAFAGLTADARILIDRARVECQSNRLTLDEPATVEGITRYIAGTIVFVFAEISNAGNALLISAETPSVSIILLHQQCMSSTSCD